MSNEAVKPPIRIGLLWHSAGSTNLGVGALTIANMKLVQGVADELGLDAQFQVIGMRDNRVSYAALKGTDAYAIDSLSLINPAGSWKAIRSRDCVIDIGGGDSFADIYGLKRFLFLWLTKMMAIWQGVPLLMAPQTIGPFRKFLYRTLAKVAMEGTRAVVVRDSVSLTFLKEVAPKAHGVLSVDVAFNLPYESHAAERGGKKTRIGINVSGLLFNEAESGNNRFGLDVDYAVLSRRFIRAMLDRPDTEVHLIVHVQSAGGKGWDEDSSLADSLKAEFPDVIRAPNFEGPSEAKSYISGLDFLVAGRMHACIAAFSAGVAVVPIAYSRKFSGLFEMLDYPWMVPVKGVGDDEAFAMLMGCLERRDELANTASVGMTKVRALQEAYRDELRKLLTEAAAR